MNDAPDLDPAAEDDAPPRRPRRAAVRLVLLVVVPLVAAFVAGIVYLHGGRVVETDNAYVKADKVPVSAEVSGTVREVLVQENARVQSNDVLFRLDRAPFEVAVAKAEAKLGAARTELAALKAAYREKEAEIAMARTREAFARRDERRQADLVERGFISAAKFDDVRQATTIASQQIATLEEDRRRIAESLGGNAASPVEQHPTYRAALAELEQARLDLARTEVRASLPGVVTRPPKPGQFVQAGATAMALVASGAVWVEANFTETDLTHVHPGQPATIRVDTYPDRTWTGEVDSLSPATGAEFSILPPQNATGNWVKIAQRVPVRIRLDAGPDLPALRAGLSAVVEIDTGHRRRLLGLAL